MREFSVRICVLILLLSKAGSGCSSVACRDKAAIVEQHNSATLLTRSGTKPRTSPIERRAGAEDSRTPLYVLLLVMTQTPAIDGWDNGPALLVSARVAVSEINEQPGLLHGYRLELIESEHEPCAVGATSLGVRNLVENAINPGVAAHTPVVAIGGLMCSGPTAEIASISTRPGVDIVNLSGANSPYFIRNKHRYPRLWRFLGSADIFVDLLLELMNTYQWERIAIVYSGDSVYYEGIAMSFRNAIKLDSSKIIVTENVIVSQEEIFYSHAISAIRSNRLRVTFVFTSTDQTAKLLCMAAKEGLVYPNYQWVLTDDSIELIKDFSKCEKSHFYQGVNHTLLTYFRLNQKSSTVLVSGSTYKEYLDRYHDEMRRLETEINATISADSEYGGIMYDQVWALAKALHLAIPALQEGNYSIEEYSYSQPEITDILGEKLDTVDFVGASSHVSFDENREVNTMVEIYHIINESSVYVGEFVAGKLTLNLSEMPPDDEWNPDVTILPTFVTALLLSGNFLVFLFVTVTLFVYVALRNQPRVKASSPTLSGLLFVGCYLLCISASCSIATIGFRIDPTPYKGFCYLKYVLIFNGMTLIFSTVLVKLLRIFKIFANKELADLSRWIWTNWFLSIMVLVLCFFTNGFLALWLTINPLHHNTTIGYHLQTVDGVEVLIAEKFSVCTGLNFEFWVTGFFAFYAVLLGAIIILTVKTRKIAYVNFKDTKKVNVFIALLVLVNTLSVAIGLILQLNDIYFAAIDITIIMGISLVTPLLCQIFLFLLKVISPQVLDLIPDRIMTSGHRFLISTYS